MKKLSFIFDHNLRLAIFETPLNGSLQNQLDKCGKQFHAFDIEFVLSLENSVPQNGATETIKVVHRIHKQLEYVHINGPLWLLLIHQRDLVHKNKTWAHFTQHFSARRRESIFMEQKNGKFLAQSHALITR